MKSEEIESNDSEHIGRGLAVDGEGLVVAWDQAVQALACGLEGDKLSLARAAT